jgi:hypothetical protein
MALVFSMMLTAAFVNPIYRLNAGYGDVVGGGGTGMSTVALRGGGSRL